MRLSIELQDILQHAQPNISDISVRETTLALDQRDKAFMSYDNAFSNCCQMPSGLVDDATLKSKVYDKREWVQTALSEVARGMNGYLRENADRWISVSRRSTCILPNLATKPSIRGIAINNGKAAPVLVIARRYINFNLIECLPFLMRGGYEFHLRNEPNFANFIVLDLSQGERGSARNVKEYRLTDYTMMPLAHFEDILHSYAEAASKSKYGLVIPSGFAIRDLFGRR